MFSSENGLDSPGSGSWTGFTENLLEVGDWLRSETFNLFFLLIFMCGFTLK